MTTRTYQPAVSRTVRIAAAIVVAVCVAAAWLTAGHESERAVRIASTGIYGPTYVTLPTVEVVAHRVTATDTAFAAL